MGLREAHCHHVATNTHRKRDVSCTCQNALKEQRRPLNGGVSNGGVSRSGLVLPFLQERKFSPKRKFWAGYPCGHPAKNFGQALQILEKQAFWNGHPARTSMKKLRSEKLRADFPFPIFVLFCPFLSFSRFFWDFPDLLGDGPGIFPIRPFSLSRPIKSTYEEQSWKGPRHNLDLSRKKCWKHPGLEAPRFSFSQKSREGVIRRWAFGQSPWSHKPVSLNRRLGKSKISETPKRQY